MIDLVRLDQPAISSPWSGAPGSVGAATDGDRITTIALEIFMTMHTTPTTETYNIFFLESNAPEFTI